MVLYLSKITDFTKENALQVIQLAKRIKAEPQKFTAAMKDKTMLMLFSKPSLKTRITFETGMTQMGGHAIYYDVSSSPLGENENLHDKAKYLSRYVDIIMAHVDKRQDVLELAKHSSVPVINGLDDYAHPCQIITDLMTICEKKGDNLSNLKIAYLGDLQNNIAYELMRAAALMGFKLNLSGPREEKDEIEPFIWEEVNKLCTESKGEVKYVHDPKEAVKDCDVIYTHNWMTGEVDNTKKEQMMRRYLPFQVNAELLKIAKQDVIFMNCMPAIRGMEQTADVIDGPHSIVFDQAENRLHAQKAIILHLCNAKPTGKKMMIALGGNALVRAKETISAENMIRNAQTTAKQLCQLIKDGHNLVVAHGNGPQVGAIFLQNQVAVAQVPEMPLNVCGAESQGQIGYIVQQALQNQLRDDGIDKCVATVVTQVEVDPNDDAFKNPSKPIGKFYTKEEAEQLRKEGKFVIEDSGRGYRVAVASPRPLRIVEAPMIIDLVNKGHIVISGGGGGIPVMRDEKGHLRGVEAVIDKDRLSSILGVTVEADIFIIITDVDYVAINFNKPNQQFLKTITLSEAKKYMEEGHFGMGSMQPKIEAAISFVEKTGKEALICSMDKVCEAVEGKAGTRIVPDP